jgi:hypothetical protein
VTDSEIVNGIAFKLVLGMQQSAKAQADAIRNDVGMIWLYNYLDWISVICSPALDHAVAPAMKNGLASNFFIHQQCLKESLPPEHSS